MKCINAGIFCEILASVQYSRNDLEIGRGVSPRSGDVLEIGPARRQNYPGGIFLAMKLTPSLIDSRLGGIQSIET